MSACTTYETTNCNVPPADSDQTLLTRFALSKDPVAFTELYHRYERAVRGTARSRLVNQADIDDAVQETFIFLKDHATRFDAQAPLGPQLWCVTRNISREISRKISRQARVQARCVQQFIERAKVLGTRSDAYELHERATLLWSTVATLGEKLRLVIELRYREGMTQVAIASFLGLRSYKVARLLCKAEASLRETLAKKGVALSAVLTTAAVTPQTGSAVSAAKSAALILNAPSQSASAVADAVVRGAGVWKWVGAATLLSLSGVAMALGSGTSDPVVPPQSPTPTVARSSHGPVAKPRAEEIVREVATLRPDLAGLFKRPPISDDGVVTFGACAVVKDVVTQKATVTRSCVHGGTAILTVCFTVGKPSDIPWSLRVQHDGGTSRFLDANVALRGFSTSDLFLAPARATGLREEREPTTYRYEPIAVELYAILCRLTPPEPLVDHPREPDRPQPVPAPAPERPAIDK